MVWFSTCSIFLNKSKPNTMNKKLFLLFLFFTLTASIQQLTAQNYKSSLGLAIDFGGNATLVGPGFKTFFSEKMATNVELGFIQGAMGLTGLFQYHGLFPNAKGLKFIAGGGTSIFFINGGGTELWLRGTTGLDYKIDKAPLALSFEWRPAFSLAGGGGMLPGRFGLGIRYVLK